MPVILVVIVVVAWMVILGPSLMKRRSRTVGEIGSISHFHQQLRVLEHSAPQPFVAPAYRLRVVGAGGDAVGTGSNGVDAPPVLTVVGADRLPRPALAFLGEDPSPAVDPGAPPASRGGGDPGESADPSGPRAHPLDPRSRHLVRRRRRDTLGVLACVIVGTLMIGFVPGASAAWLLTALAAVALAAYVAVLVHLRRMAEEREQKLRYLTPGAGDLDTGGMARIPVMSGRYAHPSNQAVAAR
jgi:hypothetical protein